MNLRILLNYKAKAMNIHLTIVQWFTLVVGQVPWPSVNLCGQALVPGALLISHSEQVLNFRVLIATENEQRVIFIIYVCDSL